MSGRCKPAVVVTPSRADDGHGENSSAWTNWGGDVMAIVIRRNPTASALTEVKARQLQEQIANLAIELVPIESVKTNPRNAKEHPSRQIALIAESIKQFGFNHPALIDEDNRLLGGHARIAAAHRLNLKQVPVLRFTNLSPQEKRAVALADNKLPELGSWNIEMLGLELKELTADVPELVFDYSITGFDTGEIDQILAGEPHPSTPDPADQVRAVQGDEVAVTQPGDSWICADHGLHCGSALEASAYRAVLVGAPADLVFADPAPPDAVDNVPPTNVGGALILGVSVATNPADTWAITLPLRSIRSY
jgi:ParB-like nuclease domain